jgi:hypothetical protein
MMGILIVMMVARPVVRRKLGISVMGVRRCVGRCVVTPSSLGTRDVMMGIELMVMVVHQIVRMNLDFTVEGSLLDVGNSDLLYNFIHISIMYVYHLYYVK